MLRKIIKIDEDKCIGCGKCAAACHEGAIEMVDGTAKLSREDYCDGLGDCLPACPVDAISFEEREAPAYDAEAVKANMLKKQQASCACPGSQSRSIVRQPVQVKSTSSPVQSRLAQWPCQIKLVPVDAPYFDNADLLVAADCTAYAYGNIHGDFMKDRITLIGCPKLDATDYAVKLGEIIVNNNIKSITVLRMEVPCCGGIESAISRALLASGKKIPMEIVTISTDGRMLRPLCCNTKGGRPCLLVMI